MRPSSQKAEESTQWRERHDGQDQANPLPRIERGIEDERHQQDSDWDDHGQTTIRPLLAFVFASPVEVILFRQRHFPPYLFDRLAHSASQIASANAVLDRDVSRIALAINRRSTVLQLDLA